MFGGISDGCEEVGCSLSQWGGQHEGKNSLAREEELKNVDLREKKITLSKICPQFISKPYTVAQKTVPMFGHFIMFGL